MTRQMIVLGRKPGMKIEINFRPEYEGPEIEEVFIEKEIQGDGSVCFGKKFRATGPHPTTIKAKIDYSLVPEGWHWPYSNYDGGWVPCQAIRQ